ncbi:MAG: LPS-assembly protein LptD [bacterium]
MILTSVLLLASASVAAAEDAAVKINALRMEYLSDGSLKATGGVDMRGDGMELVADEAVYDPEKRVIILKGDVRMMEAEGGGFSGDEMEFDLETMTGSVKKGVISLGKSGFRITGDTISRKGINVYEVENGTFTTCPGDCPDWYFAASRIRVREKGYLTAKNATFRIGGVPVFYSPFFFYPVKTERQSGLLFPEIGFTERFGWEISLPVFLTIGRSADATLTPRYFSRNPTGLGGEFRYSLPWGGGGEWSGFLIEEEEGHRWYAAGGNSWRIAPGLWLRGSWYDSSDDTVSTDYGDDFLERNPGVAERNLTAEYSGGPLELWAGVSELTPDGSKIRATDGLERTGGGITFRTGKVGASSGKLNLDAERFGDSDKRFIVEPELAVYLGGPGPFSGRLWGRLSMAEGADVPGDDSYAVYGFEERTSLIKKGPWGTHRLDFSVEAVKATAGAFSASAVRDRRDGSVEKSLLSGEVKSRLDSKSVVWTLRTGAWMDSEADTSLGYLFSSLEWEDVNISATVNRDGEYGLVLPDPGVASIVGRGWTVSSALEKERYSLELIRESTENVGETLYSDFSLIFGKVTLSGSGLFDMESDKIVEESGAFSYRGPCWEIGITREKNLAGVEWKLKFSIF